MSSSGQRGAAALARIAAFAVLVSLGACGGGSSSPSPTLTASAAADHAAAGGQSVALTAVASNSTDTVTWSLSGPGSLSATSGANVDYVPPAPDALDAGTQATITATLGTLTKTVVLNVATAPGGTWETTQLPSGDAAAVVQGNGTYVLVGAHGEIEHSTDATTWKTSATGTANDLTGVAYGPAGFVAVGNHGTVVSSPDGITWTPEPSLATTSADFDLGGITYAHGLYIAVGNHGVYTSPDGATWTGKTLFAGLVYRGGIALGGNRVVAVTSAGVAWSDDGVTWTNETQAGTSLTRIAYGNGRFLAGGASGVSSSADGTTWSSPVVVGDEPLGVSFAGGHFFLSTSSVLSISTDGTTWTTSNNPAFADADEVSTVFTTTPAGGYVMLGYDGLVATSTDLANWTLVGTSGNAFAWRSLAWANGVYLATDDASKLWKSTDARTWTAEPGLNMQVMTVTAANGHFFALGYGMLGTSSDGVQWTTQATDAQDRFLAVTWGGGQYVALGERGSILTSPDGATWTTVTGPDGAFYQASAYGAGLFVTFNAINPVTSADGVHWTTSTTQFPHFVNSVTYGAQGFVASSDGLWHSADGLTWTQVRTTPGQRYALSYGNGRYVAVGEDGLTLTSSDGITWTQRSQDVTWGLYAITYGADQFVAVGDRGVVVVSTH